jgi:hypothetical protein
MDEVVMAFVLTEESLEADVAVSPTPWRRRDLPNARTQGGDSNCSRRYMRRASSLTRRSRSSASRSRTCNPPILEIVTLSRSTSGSSN